MSPNMALHLTNGPHRRPLAANPKTLCVEMSSSNLKAYCLGAVVVATVPCLAAVLLRTLAVSGWLSAVIVFGPVVFSGFITAWMALSQKMLLATLLSLPFTLSWLIEGTVEYLLGYPLDVPLIWGLIMLGIICLPLGAVLCGFGAIISWWATRSKQDNASQALGEDAGG